MDKLQTFRKIVQSIFFVYFILTASFCLCFYGILEQIFLVGFSNNIQKLIVISILTIILGRVFCGFICPLGFLQDISYKLNKSNKRIKDIKYHDYLKYFKYLVMVIFLILTYYLSVYAFCQICPIGALTNLTATLLAFIILFLVIITSYFIPRAFCRYFCPLGAFLSILSIKPVFKLKLNKETCVKCKLCEFKCPMRIKIT
ncbi:4Fe-4S binding protein, partial [Methanocaldococcus sp.]